MTSKLIFTKSLNLYYYKESSLVVKSDKEKVVIGRLENKEFIPFDDKTLKLCEEYGMEPDESKIEKKIIETKTEDEFYKLFDVIEPFKMDGDLLFKKLKEDEDSFRLIKLKLNDIGKNLFDSAKISIKFDNISSSLFRFNFSFIKPKPFSNKEIFLTEKLSLEQVNSFETTIKNIYFICKKCTESKDKCRCYIDEVIQYENEESCPICLETVTSNNRIETRCGHHIHKYCVLGYFKSKKENKCPLCRGTMLSRVVLNTTEDSDEYGESDEDYEYEW